MLPSAEARRKSAAEAGDRWLSARLSPDEMLLLDRQGFVAFDRLRSGATRAKLRFRDRDGRQRVVYLGVNLALAEQVAAHLAVRQAATRRRRASKRLQRRARRLLRSIKPRLEGHVNSDQWHFHGRQLRRKRCCAAEEAALHSPNRQKGVPMPDDQRAGSRQEPHAPKEFDFLGASSGSRFDAMRRWADCQESPFDAIIGHVTADMCEISGELAEQLKAELCNNRRALDESNGVDKNMQHFLQLQRHMERFIKLAPLQESRASRAKNRTVDTYAAQPLAAREGPRTRPNADSDLQGQPDS